MITYGYSSVGLVRTQNEDVFTCDLDLYLDEEIFISSKVTTLCVYDGVGGNDFGEVAAYTCAKYIKDNINKFNVEKTIVESNNLLKELKKTYPKYRDMATTLAGVYIDGNKLHIFNVGDSRVYRVRNGLLIRLSRDHNYQNYIKQYNPFINTKDIKGKENVITSYLGKEFFNSKKDINYIIDDYGFIKNDYLIITTDGITDLITDEELEDIYSSKGSFQEKASSVINLVNKRGATDNFTIIQAQKLEGDLD